MPPGVYKHKPNQGFQKGHKLFMNPENLKGRKFSAETKAKMSASRMGRVFSQETKDKISKAHVGKKISETHRINLSISHIGTNSGEKHYLWKGGKNSETKRARNSYEYQQWRTAVFQRDNYTCIWCGNNKSGNLNADHIKQFAYFPELRFDINNGRTLCIDCHKKTDTYLKSIPKDKLKDVVFN